VHEDWAVVQAVDPATGQDVPDGQWGDLVVTTLDRDNGLLRYDLEEACMIVREPCSCGETTIRGFWGGRFKDLIGCQGTRFFLHELEGALRSVGAVAKPSLEYQVVKPSDEAAPLQVRVELGGDGGDKTDVANTIRGAITEQLGVDASVDVLDRDTLPRAGYKATRMVDS
jgi:phenylacetate-CoA ligase